MRRALQTDRRTHASAPRFSRRSLATYLGLVCALSRMLSRPTLLSAKRAPDADARKPGLGPDRRPPLDLAYRTPIGTVPGADTRPSGHSVISNGHHLSSSPTGPFTVGLMDYPDCLQMLEALGGVWVEAWPPRSFDRGVPETLAMSCPLRSRRNDLGRRKACQRGMG